MEENEKVEEKVEEKKEETKKNYELVEVTTQTAPAIQTPKGELITTEKAIVDILNKIKEIADSIL